jgi:ubiquinone/menaquinone biosynthesis C-methylase UbiE
MGEGTRHLTLDDTRPNCAIVNNPAYRLEEVVFLGAKVADIGCGHGPLRHAVEALGGKWIGIEPFPVSEDVIKASAEELPFADNEFDVVIMNAVTEHIPDISRAFAEVGRTLKPGGNFVGYSAYMECFHEISYNHISHKSLEEYSRRNGMRLVKIAASGAFGIDYHIARLLEPFVRFNSWPIRKILRPTVQAVVHSQLRLLEFKRYLKNRIQRKMVRADAREEAALYRDVETLRYAAGFTFLIEKLAPVSSESGGQLA